jgi:hypothetical protein
MKKFESSILIKTVLEYTKKYMLELSFLIILVGLLLVWISTWPIHTGISIVYKKLQIILSKMVQKFYERL